MPKMVFIEKNGNRKEVDAPIGLSVMEIAHRHGVDIEGACDGASTTASPRVCPRSRSTATRRAGSPATST